MMMPESMGGWTSLTHLYLGENLLTHIPASVGELNKLTVLRLENNRFGGLPDTLDGYVLNGGGRIEGVMVKGGVGEGRREGSGG